MVGYRNTFSAATDAEEMQVLRNPILCVEAERVFNTERSYTYSYPRSEHPALIRIGAAPTPISILNTLETDQKIVLFLFETLGRLSLVTIDKESAAVTTIPVPDALNSYGSLVDKTNPNIIWFTTCANAALYRFDARTNNIKQIVSLDPETYVFGFDQADDGAFYLGTYPGAKCLKVDVKSDPARVSEIPIDRRIIENKAYLHGIFSCSDDLYLHYISPSSLIRYNLKTQKAEIITDAKDQSLRFKILNNTLSVTAGKQAIYFGRDGRPAKEPSPVQPGFSVNVSGYKGIVSYREKKLEV